MIMEPAAAFQSRIASITAAIAGRAIDQALEDLLNQTFPPDGEDFKTIETACHQATRDGWMCNREHAGIRFGRVIKPSGATHGFSVDVVYMQDIAGPHHRHPQGEIDMIMPISPSARFDGRGAGWLVYAPGSAHSPTVSEGEALVLYLLPQGEIEFGR
jgi:hypothetical protein